MKAVEKGTKMKTIRFSYPHHTGGYGCNTPGDNSGLYVPAAVAQQLLDACQAIAALSEGQGRANMLEVAGQARAAIAAAEAEEAATHV